MTHFTDTRLRGSLPFKIVLFFARMPEEVLSIMDVAEKWGVPYLTAQQATYRLCKSGWIAKVKADGGRTFLYEAGPQLLEEIQ